MKKIATLFTLFICCCQVATAQFDPQAKEILDRVSTKYGKMNAFKANFINKIENKEAAVDEEYSGIVHIKDDLFRLESDTKIIYYDGSLIREYDSDLQEYSIRVPDADIESLNLTSILNLYKDGYKYRVREQNATGYVIELVPQDQTKSFHKILMKFSNNFDVKSFTYFEKNGNLVSTIVETFEEKPNLTKGFFNFFKANLEVIDSVDLR